MTRQGNLLHQYTWSSLLSLSYEGRELMRPRGRGVSQAAAEVHLDRARFPSPSIFKVEEKPTKKKTHSALQASQGMKNGEIN